MSAPYLGTHSLEFNNICSFCLCGKHAMCCDAVFTQDDDNKLKHCAKNSKSTDGLPRF